MSTVTSVGSTSGGIFVPTSTGGTLTVAAALSALRLRSTSSVSIRDSAENIQRNLDALSSASARISGLAASGDTLKLTVSAAQYERSNALLQTWSAGAGQTVEIAGATAAQATTLAATKPAWVSGISVSDTAANLQRRMDDLQALATGGSLRQIVQIGAASPLRMTAAQLASRSDVLALFRNQAYTVAVTDASVAETVGLNGQAALADNSRVRTIDVKDSTAAIENNLDALQRLGLRLRSVSQTGADTSLTVTGAQYAKNTATIGKIVTPFQLDVLRATAAQSAQLAADRKVLTVTVADTAANIARSWALVQRLGESISGLQVTDTGNAITLNGGQLALSEALLTRLGGAAAGANDYRLNVTGVRAGQAQAAAAVDRVDSVVVQDTADNVAAAFDTLDTLVRGGKLGGIVLSNPNRNIALDASRLLGPNASATQAVLDTIRGGRYGLAAEGATTSQLADLSANSRVLAINARVSSTEIAANLDTLFGLGRRLASIRQTDAGATVALTQARFESRPGVLNKIDGGFRVSLTEVSASRAAALAANSSVVKLSVADTGRSLAAAWSGLRSLGGMLDGVVKTDAGALTLSADDYLAGRSDGLLAKFDSAQRFNVTQASVASALSIAPDTAAERIEVADQGGAVTARLSDLESLRSSGKLATITLAPGTSMLSLRAAQLGGAQAVLDLVRGGRYTLSVDEADVANVAQLATNTKITQLQARGDAAGIVANLDALAGMGARLRSIARTDATSNALSLTGAVFEQRRAALEKIVGGYAAELTQVQAAKAGTLATQSAVRSLQVADTGAALSAAWTSLDAIGAKLTGVAQSDSANVSVTRAQWAAGTALAAKWSTPLAVSVSGARVADLAALAAAGAVQQVQLSDDADSLSAAWGTLAAQTKLTGIEISDPSRALRLTAASFNASTALLGMIRGSRYTAALSEVDVADVATLAANTRVTSMEVRGAAAAVSQGFDGLATLADAGRLDALTLDETNGQLELTAAQVRSGSALLESIEGSFRVKATAVSMADLDDMQATPEVTSIALQDNSISITDRLPDLAEMGALLDSITFTDASPVLAMTQAERSAMADTLAKISGSYQIDLTEALAASVQTLDANSTVRSLAVSDSAARISEHWDALLAAWDAGDGKLAEIDVSDGGTIALTQAQRDAGEDMIAALLAGRTVVTIG